MRDVHREHRHAHTEDLAGAEMAVCDFSFAEEFVELGRVEEVAVLMSSMLRLLVHPSLSGEECDGSVAVVADRSYLPDLSAELSGYGWRWRG